MSEYNVFKPGAAVVTNTMVIKATSFLENASVCPQVEEFFDLCSLIEAVVLRDEIVTLEGETLGPAREYTNAPLPTLLRNERILRENAVPIVPADLQKVLCLIAGTDRVFNRLDVRGLSIYITDMFPEIFPDETDRQRSVDPALPERYWFMKLAQHSAAGKILKRSHSVFKFFRGEDFVDFLRGTGDEERGGYALRTYLYGYSAWRARLTFIPDFPRIPFLENLLDILHRDVVTEGYQLLAQKLRCEAEDFLKDVRPIGLPIPPFTSLLLARCNSPHDVLPNLMELRKEFSELRRNLALLERSRLEVTDIHERNKIRRQIEEIFLAVSRQFNRNGYARFKEAIDYVGDIVGVAFDWSNPSSYRTTLLTKPYEIIRDWWLRRPLAQFFHVADEFRHISEYNQLVNRVFGVRFREEDIELFRVAVENLEAAFRGHKNG